MDEEDDDQKVNQIPYEGTLAPGFRARLGRLGRGSKPSFQTSKRSTLRRNGQESRKRESPVALCRIDRCIRIFIYITSIQTSACPEHLSAYEDGSRVERHCV